MTNAAIAGNIPEHTCVVNNVRGIAALNWGEANDA
jgi:hypothetical protein